MQPTRRWWVLAGVGVVLLAVALIGERPLLLLGAGVLGGFCLVTAAQAVAAFRRTAARLDSSVNVTPTRVPVGGDTTVSIVVTVDAPLEHPVVVDCEFPPGVEHDVVRIALEPGETRAQATVAPHVAVAGRFELPTLSARFESPDGHFTEEVPLGDVKSEPLVAEAQGTSDIHTGAGGTPLRGLFGSHGGETHGQRGDDLASIREYQPGDSVRRVDWKTTARLDEPHVREYETEFEQATRLVVDTRRRTGSGAPGRTKLDYLREVALGVARSAEAGDDPLALTVVDDTGIRLSTDTASTDDHYRRIRESLLRLAATDEPSRQSATAGTTGPADARRQYQALQGRADSPFVATLEPFFSRTGSYVATLSQDSLFEAVRRTGREASQGTWTVLLTDDSERTQLFETVRLATRGNGRATAFVTPSALFETQRVVDLESAYTALVAFEEFRQRLDRLPRAKAYEVAPDDRLRAVLAQGRDRSRSRSRRRVS